MPTFTIRFDITVSGLGKQTVNLPNVVAVDAIEAITQAKLTLVQIVCTGALLTAP